MTGIEWRVSETYPGFEASSVGGVHRLGNPVALHYVDGVPCVHVPHVGFVPVALVVVDAFPAETLAEEPVACDTPATPSLEKVPIATGASRAASSTGVPDFSQKLDAEKAAAIRVAHGSGSGPTALSREYGVSVATIRRVLSGKVWK